MLKTMRSVEWPNPPGAARSVSYFLRESDVGSADMEARLRRLVAEQLGVDVVDLHPACSLLDDLAADSLDMAELTLALEAELGVTLSDGVVDRLRTFGDLVHQVKQAPARREHPPTLAPVLARVRLTIPPGRGGVRLERTGPLTPYMIEVIVEDALRAGSGARLDIEIPPGSDASCLAPAEPGFARLARRGIAVVVHRGRGAAARPAA